MRKISWQAKWAAVFVAAAFVAPGCILQPKDSDAERFREAIPQAESVQVSGPEDAQQSGSATGQSIQADEPWANGPWAKWYGFTRHVRKGVNGITGIVLGGIWLVVHTKPTSVTPNEATWGPYTDSLEPVTWRFRVTEVGADEYEYVLEGRPKQSESEAAYRSVLKGKGWGKGHASHGDGYFEIDLDTAKELDPFEHQDDSGKVKVTHDLPPDITTDLFSQPRSVTAEVKPSNSTAWFTVTSNSNADGTGTLLVDAHADADDSNLTQEEDISIKSQWNKLGEGRADINISGGDVPASMDPVKAVECWGADFYRVYYSDSVSWEPTEGEASACAFAGPPSEI